MTAALITFVLSLALCGLYRVIALRVNLVDRPNARSSHQQVTPLGGGLPMFLAFFAGLAIAASAGEAWGSHYWLLALACVPLILAGIYDDVKPLSVALRMGLYVIVVIVFVLQVIPAETLGTPLRATIVVASIALALLWLLNLYNFMDGIDGIAATQAVLACVCAALLCTDPGGSYARICLLFAAACCGFLVWNWPGARLFMGDAGSVPTGFLLGVLALLGWQEGQLNVYVWPLLLAPFLLDATWTLFWRLATGQAVTQAHRQHAYQRLSRHWGSHRAVDVLLIAMLLFWFFPFAWAVQRWPAHALFLVILAYLPWVIAMAKIRSIK